MSEGFRVDQIDHVELFVPSRRDAATWYQRALGLKILTDLGAGSSVESSAASSAGSSVGSPIEPSVGSSVRMWAKDPGGPLMITTHSGRTKLALFRTGIHGDSPEGRPTAGFHRVAFRVDGEDFLRAIDYLPTVPVLGDDGQAVGELVPVDHQAAFSLYFFDPWGHRLEVTTYDHRTVRRRLGSSSG